MSRWTLCAQFCCNPTGLWSAVLVVWFIIGIVIDWWFLIMRQQSRGLTFTGLWRFQASTSCSITASPTVSQVASPNLTVGPHKCSYGWMGANLQLGCRSASSLRQKKGAMWRNCMFIKNMGLQCWFACILWAKSVSFLLVWLSCCWGKNRRCILWFVSWFP